MAWAGLPFIVAAFLRLHGIGELEPFVDEGANILTALDPRVRRAFEPLEQGRPLLVWLFLPTGLFPTLALEIARSMTAFAGLTTMAAVGWTLYMLAGRGAALIGIWIWAVLPIAVWHERLALQDPFVTACLGSSIALMTAGSQPSSRKRQLWVVGAGLLIGIAFLLKISAVLTFPWLGLVYLGIQAHFGRPLFDRRIAWMAGGAILPVLMLGSGLQRLGSALDRYEALPKLAGGMAGTAALERLEIWLGWYIGYGGWVLLLLVIASLAIGIRLRSTLGWAFFAGSGVSLLISSFVLNNVYARYALPDHLPLILFIALVIGSAHLGRWRTAALVAVVLALARWAWVGIHIGINPVLAAVPHAEKEQYVTGLWSGRGVRQVHQYLVDYALRNNALCVVLVHRFLRPGCYGLLLAQLGDPRVGVVPFTVYEPEELSTALALVRRRTEPDQQLACFLLYEGSQYPAQPWLDDPWAPTRLVHTIDRGKGEAFKIYHVEP